MCLNAHRLNFYLTKSCSNHLGWVLNARALLGYFLLVTEAIFPRFTHFFSFVFICTQFFNHSVEPLISWPAILVSRGRGGTFAFSFQVPPVYPHEPPKVKCKTKVYHPNIDLEGNVCLNILREDWKPVLNINTIIYGLFHLFTQPNYEDPLNHDAAAVLRDNPKLFESNVRRAMVGGYVGQTLFPRCM
ncbi:hypothetical protein F0562_020606 [Nyssa sinensis]|uniref:UBC core domain-containing protein n=1 Tax=Nyssa sinensis TaxID=561372 RepID=A0A5J5BS48_9ASTE|nr:hypothetical protein F0562_020606 [Nyssa sinensis]